MEEVGGKLYQILHTKNKIINIFIKLLRSIREIENVLKANFQVVSLYAKRKVLLLMAGPLRPYPPVGLNGRIHF